MRLACFDAGLLHHTSKGSCCTYKRNCTNCENDPQNHGKNDTDDLEDQTALAHAARSHLVCFYAQNCTDDTADQADDRNDECENDRNNAQYERRNAHVFVFHSDDTSINKYDT